MDRHRLTPSRQQSARIAAHSVTLAADHAVRDGALAMAWTAIDCAADQALRARLLVTP